MTELQAALLLSQFTRLAEQTERRRRNASMLTRLLAEAGGILPMSADPRVTGNAWHLYIMRYDRGAFGGAPKAAFVEAVWLGQNMLLGGKEDMEDIAAAVEKIRRCRGELQTA
jgi:dTDP-4-amino-4,6-dideoxygalactose transaminase